MKDLRMTHAAVTPDYYSTPYDVTVHDHNSFFEVVDPVLESLSVSCAEFPLD